MVLTSLAGCGGAACRVVAAEVTPGSAAISVSPSAAPSSTPPRAARDPQLDTAAQAIGSLVYGKHAPFGDVYGSQRVDYADHRLVLYVTDLSHGGQLVRTARNAHPEIADVTVQMIRCRFSSHQEVAVLHRLLAMGSRLGYPVLGGGPTDDGSGVRVATTAEGLDSNKFRAKVEKLAAPVHVEFVLGAPAIPAAASG